MSENLNILSISYNYEHVLEGNAIQGSFELSHEYEATLEDSLIAGELEISHEHEVLLGSILVDCTLEVPYTYECFLIDENTSNINISHTYTANLDGRYDFTIVNIPYTYSFDFDTFYTEGIFDITSQPTECNFIEHNFIAMQIRPPKRHIVKLSVANLGKIRIRNRYKFESKPSKGFKIKHPKPIIKLIEGKNELRIIHPTHRSRLS